MNEGMHMMNVHTSWSALSCQ